MKTMRKFVLAFIVLALALPLWAQDQEKDGPVPDAEAALARLVNQEREKAGLPALHFDDRLSVVAREHSQLLAQHHLLSHQFEGEAPLPKRVAARFVRFNSDGENVVFDADIESAHAGLMLSPPHRANILNPKYDAFGVGVVRRGKYLWVTEDFVHRVADLSAEKAGDSIAEALTRARRGGPRLTRVNVPALNRLACDMAKQDRLDTRRALDTPGAQSAVVYTADEPVKLPSDALGMAEDRNIRKFAVGVCFADSLHYPAGTYWVVLLSY